MKSLFLALAAIGLCQATFHKKANEPLDHSHNKGFLQDNEIHQGQGNQSMLYIHLVPHSHDDVGWLKTVDGYFEGARTDIQDANVEMTIDTAIMELLRDPTRTYTQVEMKFFSMWWKRQDLETKQAVRALAKEGRLEFVNAGWSMHDEACTHYEDMIDNMLLGHEFLLAEVGVKPRIGWHIDPFGHSTANARLFAEMGFDAIYFARGDFQDTAKRMNESSMQWLWRPQWKHLGKRAQLLAFMMIDNSYYSPPFFDFFDKNATQGPFITDPESTEFNADWKSEWFVNYVTEKSLHFRTNHLMFPMGGDFQYINAHMHYKYMDRMISYINARYPNVTLMYSTPSRYIDALFNANISWPTRYDDMFPYADLPEDYWTGYFTSRAGSKWQVREGQAFMHATNWLYSLKALDVNSSDQQIHDILSAKFHMMDTMGLLQHHDAITGTAKQYVADDYTHRMFKSVRNNSDQYEKMINRLSYRTTGISAHYWSQCQVNNGTYLDCPIANWPNQTFVVAVQNPSMDAVNYQKIKVPTDKYSAQVWSTATKTFVAANSSVICHLHTLENGYEIQDCDLWIENTVEGKSLAWLQIYPDPSRPVNPASGFQKFDYQVETQRGSLFKIFNDDGVTYKYLTLQLRYYESNIGHDGYPGSDNVPSGAYIFKPAKDKQHSLPYVNLVNHDTSYGGSFMQQTNMYFNDPETNRSARIIMRAFAKNPAIDVEVRLYPIPASEGGQEVTVNFFAYGMDTNETFYTDSNAMEMQQRVLNKRPTWNLTTNQNISANYYPINSAIVINDVVQNLSFVVTNDRSQGGSVFEDSRIEFMHNRRLFDDDDRGVVEPLSENGTFGNGIPIQATYTMHFVNKSTTYSKQRQQQLAIDDPLQYNFAFNYTVFTTTDNMEVESTQDLLSGVVKQSKDQVPVPVKIISYPMDRNLLLVRIENIADLFDYPAGSTLDDTVTYFDLNQLARNLYQYTNGNSYQLQAINIKEMQLTGITSQSDTYRSKYQWIGVDDAEVTEPVLPKDKPFNVVALSAQRVRQFYIHYVPLNSNYSVSKKSQQVIDKIFATQ